MTDNTDTDPTDLAEIEAHAIRRSDALMVDWENAVNSASTLRAAHAYAALALAAGQRIARLTRRSSEQPTAVLKPVLPCNCTETQMLAEDCPRHDLPN